LSRADPHWLVRGVIAVCSRRTSQRKRLGCRALAISVALVSSVNFAASGRGARPLSIDDILNMEDVGRAISDGTGSRIVYDRMLPYKRRPDFGVEQRFLDATASSLMVLERREPLNPRPLFRSTPNTGYLALSFSPSGRYFAFLLIRLGKVSLGIYDFASKSVRIMPGTPNFGRVMGAFPAWVRDDKIAYSVLPVGEQPYDISGRRENAANLVMAWRRSWDGREPSFRSLQTSLVQKMVPRKGGTLVLTDVRTATAARLASGTFINLAVASGGHWLAALKRTPLPALRSASSGEWLDARFELRLFDIDKPDAPIICANLSVSPETLQWRGDGQKLAFFAWPNGATARAGQYRVFDRSSKTVSAWPHRGLDLASQRERGQLQQPERAVWIGQKLAVAARPLNDAGADPQFSYRNYHDLGDARDPKSWWALDMDRPPVLLTSGIPDVTSNAVSGWGGSLWLLAKGDIWRLDPSGERTNLTGGKLGYLALAATPEDLWGIRPDQFRKNIVLSSSSLGSTEYFVLNTPNATISRIASASPGSLALLTAFGSTSALFRKYVAHESSVELLSESRPPAVVERLNQHLSKVAVARTLSLSYRSSIDGRELNSCLTLPAPYEPRQRYPLIVEVYPSEMPVCYEGGDGLTKTKVNGLIIPPELFSARGYAYLVVSSPPDLQRSKSGPLANMPENVADGVEAAVDKGYADTNRVGLLGVSQGGFAALWIASQTDRYKAVVSENGWADPWRHYFDANVDQLFQLGSSSFDGQSVRYEAAGDSTGIGATPWSDPGAYLRNSPIANADKIRSPVLLINSDFDGFNAGEYDAMFVALHRLNRPAQYLTYWGEGHGASSPANIRHSWEAIFGWFDHYLRPKDSASISLGR
jgi:dipeptidyl aminopeptidase/acylaminoacyl peptidase